MRSLSYLFLCLFTLGVAGIADPGPPKPPTLRTEPRIPADKIKDYYKAKDWGQMVDQPITAYAIMRGKCDLDTRAVRFEQEMLSFPDPSRDARARNVAKSTVKQVQFPLAIHGNSYLFSVRVKVWIIFYESSPEDWVALFYAEAEGGGKYFEVVDSRQPKTSARPR